MKNYCIWIDADSCPIEVRELVFRFSKRLSIQTILVANHLIPHPKNEFFSMIICEQTQDAADNYIVENSKNTDIVITRDIPLAARLVDKKVTTINDRGLLFTPENIKEKLSMRNFNYDLLQSGFTIERITTLGKKEINSFANCLDREIQKKNKQ